MTYSVCVVSLPPHKCINAHHLAVAYDARFSRLPIFHRDGDRDQAIEWKIEIADCLASPMENLAARDRECLQVGSDLFVDTAGQSV